MRLLTTMISIALTGIGGMPAAARAAEARKLTLDEALEIARQSNRDLRAAKARLKQAEVGIDQALVALLPTATAQGKYTHNYKGIAVDFSAGNQPLANFVGNLEMAVPALNTPQIEAFRSGLTQPQIITITPQEQLDGILNLTVPVIVPYAYAALSAARKSYDAGEATYDSSEAITLLQAAQAFYVAAGTDEVRKARQHAIQVAKETLDNAQVRFQNGVVNKVEVSRAELALLRAQQADVDAADAQATAYRSLATILVLRDPFIASPPPSPKVIAGTVDELAQKAVSLRPEAIAATRTIDAAESQQNAAAWRWAPTLSAFGVGRIFNYGGFAGDKYSWAIGATLDWLLYDGGARDAQRHLVEAQRIESEARLALLVDTIRDEIANADASVKSRTIALQTAQRSVDLSTETLDLVRAQHDAGTATQIDLLTAQDSLVAAEVAVVQARFDLALSRINLERAAGLFPAKKE